MTLPHLDRPSSTLAGRSLSPYLSPTRQHVLGVAGGARVAEVTSDRAFITSVRQYGHGRRVGIGDESRRGKIHIKESPLRRREE